LPEGIDFTPLMTAYLTDSTDAADIAQGYAEGAFVGRQAYPAHATTGSAHGVTDVANIRGVLETMQDIGMPLLVHGEVTITMSTSSTARRCSSNACSPRWCASCQGSSGVRAHHHLRGGGVRRRYGA
jgi:hypothetical protein